MFFKIALRACFALICLFLSGCGMPEKRELRVLTSTAITSLDPHTTDDSSTLSFLSNIYEPLVSSTESNQAVPVLAISWSNPDENTWRFDLRMNVRFHEGSSFTAEDVKYSIDRGTQHPQSWIRPELPLMRVVRVVDADTVEIVTEKPAPLLLNNMTRVLIVPKNSENYLSKRCNGTGPYKLVKFQRDGTVVQGFLNYWKGKPYWNRAVFVSDSDPNQRINAILNDRADVIDHPPEEDLPRLEGEKKARVVQSPGLKMTILGFLVKDSSNPFSDPAVRRAVALTIDQQLLINEAFFGLAERSNQLVPPEVFGYSTDLMVPRQDLKQAKEIIAQSNFRDGFRQFLYFGKGSSKIADPLVRQLQPLGIELEKRELEWAELDGLLQAQKLPAYLVQWTFPVKDSGDILYFGFHTKTQGREYGALNFSGFSDPTLDRILEQSASEMKVERRRLLLNESMKIAMDSNAFVPLCIRRNFFVVNNNLEWTGNISGKIILEEIRFVSGR